MKKETKKGLKSALFGTLVGFVNGMFGAGGGLIAVPLLEKQGLNKKEAHANAVAVILPITVLSAFLYILKGSVNLNDSFKFIPSGILGSLIGTFILKKISPFYLKKLFSLFMIYAGIRLLIR